MVTRSFSRAYAVRLLLPTTRSRFGFLLPFSVSCTYVNNVLSVSNTLFVTLMLQELRIACLRFGRELTSEEIQRNSVVLRLG